MYDNIAGLLGDTCTTGFASNDRQQNAKASQAIPVSRQRNALSQMNRKANIIGL
jgi:hypothetical protein